MAGYGVSRSPGAALPDAVRLALVSGRLSVAVARTGLTLSEVSQESGVSLSALSRYVRGERMVSTHALIALCPVLRVSSNWLLGLDRPTARHLEDAMRSTAPGASGRSKERKDHGN